MPSTYVRRPGERHPHKELRQRIRIPRWVDPMPWIQGSSIEKMVMAEFIRRGIWFEHTPQTNALVWPPGAQEAWGATDLSTLEPDFYLPQYKIWLEIQGAYFHTLPGAVEKDSLRFVLIEAAGWKPIYWWEDDIRLRIQDLFNAVPEFYFVEPGPNEMQRVTPGLPFFEGGDGIDHLAGLRKALSNRGRPPKIKKRKKKKLRSPK